MERKELKRCLIISAFIVGICVVVKNLSLFGEIIALLFSALSPLLIGCAIAYVCDIIMSFFERHFFPKKQTGFITYIRRPVCLVLTFAIIIFVIALLFNIVIPELVDAMKLISAEIPKYAVKTKDYIVKYMNDYPEIQSQISNIEIDWEEILDNAFNIVKVGASGIITTIAEIVSSVVITVTHIIIAIIFAIYLLLRKNKLRSDLVRTKNAYLNEKVNRSLTKVLHITHDTFKSFFVGQFTEAIILGALCTIGMFILKIPYAAMTGAVIGVTALIPIVGAYVGAAVGAFVICTVDPMKALIFLIFLVLLQQFEGNVIYPKVVGTSVGLPGIWVLAAITVGGGLFGILGMLLGVPTLATVYKIYHEKLNERELKLGIADPPESEGKQEKKKKSKIRKKFSFKFKNKK